MDMEGYDVPHSGIKWTDKKSNTKVKPFSFDTKDQERLRKKKLKIEEVCSAYEYIT